MPTKLKNIRPLIFFRMREETELSANVRDTFHLSWWRVFPTESFRMLQEALKM
jgi:hypothetical protein